MENSKTDHRLLTLKKLRRHCRSPGVGQIVSRHIGPEAIPVSLCDKKSRATRQVSEKHSNSIRSGYCYNRLGLSTDRSQMLSTGRRKRVPEHLRKAKPKHHTHSNTADDRETHFRKISGCILSGPVSNIGPNESIATALKYCTASRDAHGPDENKSPLETTSTPGACSSNFSPCPSSEHRGDQAHNSIEPFTERFALLAKNVDTVLDGLKPLDLHRINPELRRISCRVNEVRAALDRQSNIATESESGAWDIAHSSQSSGSSGCELPAFFGSTNDIVTTSPAAYQRDCFTYTADHRDPSDCEEHNRSPYLCENTRTVSDHCWKYMECDSSMSSPADPSLPQNHEMPQRRYPWDDNPSDQPAVSINSLQYRSPSRVLCRSPSTPTRFLDTLTGPRHTQLYEELGILHAESGGNGFDRNLPSVDEFRSRTQALSGQSDDHRFT